ncbi:MAG: selenide, water dikinase SelD [Bacteroidales bacterium]
MPSNDDSGAIAKSSEEIKLTQYTHGLGCACKIEPQKLEEVLKKLTVLTNKNVLIGTENSDDAAVYQLSDDIALVQTLDFFTPIVDNPFDFGAIAAANALSDIYAMGATPIFALNIVGFPEKTLPLSVLEQILLGAQSKANEAGIPILGGHTIEDPEPKYGMVASGTVHPKKVVSNKGAQPGDALILTKPIGTGILSTAVKRGVATEDVAKFMIKLMSTLNKRAAELFANHKVNACTDVTGFGLLGHLHEMTSASGVCATIDFKKVPFIDEAKNLASAGVIPGGTHKNLSFMESKVDFEGLSQTQKLLISDAQTSGGLLIAIPKSMANNYCQEFNSQSEFEATIIGQITSKGDGRIRVVATT